MNVNKMLSMTEKEKFLEFFKEELYFKDTTEETGSISFEHEKIELRLEDDNWEDICFDLFISDNNRNKVYLTCVTSVKELKKLLKVLNFI